MKIRHTALTLAMASVLGAAPLLISGVSVAADNTEQATDSTTEDEAVVTASAEADESSFINTVDEAFKALRDIRAARLAIFDGAPDEASRLIDEAQKDLTVARDSMHEHVMMTQKQAEGDDGYIPFDASMSLAEGFVADAEKSAALEKANEHLSSGQKAEAVEALKLANIEVSVSAALLPATKSLAHVEDAMQLMEQEQYYEANMALKAVEDSIIVESYDLYAIPVQGARG